MKLCFHYVHYIHFFITYHNISFFITLKHMIWALYVISYLKHLFPIYTFLLYS